MRSGQLKPVGSLFASEESSAAPEDSAGNEPSSKHFAEQLVAGIRAKQVAAGMVRESDTSDAPQGSAKKPTKATPSLKAAKPKAAAPVPTQDRLPYWADHQRGVSNDMARSSLFTVRQSKEREHFKAHSVATLRNNEIMYTGEELRQRDEDVLLQLLHFGRMSDITKPVSFVARDMLKQLGWTINSRSYRELQESIERMKATSVEIKNRTGDTVRGYGGSLIASFAYESRGTNANGAGTWKVTFDRTIIGLFSHVAYTAIDWEQRKALAPLAKWLHSFYFTHRAPFAMKVETLMRLCGSGNDKLFKFRFQLKGALDALVDVGFLESWAIDGADLVRVVRKGVTPDTVAISTDGETDAD